MVEDWKCLKARLLFATNQNLFIKQEATCEKILSFITKPKSIN